MGTGIVLILFLLIVVGVPTYIAWILAKTIIKKVKRNQHKTVNPKIKESEWKSEWRWDEESQTWVHPLSGKPEPAINREEAEPEAEIDFSHAYQAQQLFTRNEWQNYKTLKAVAEVKGYVICPKVRLLDIVKPKNGEKKYKTLLYKIQSKHVDFVICDQNMNIKAIIELDDSSHDTQKRRERDAFVDKVLRSVGYKVIHTRYINHDILDLI